MYPCKIRIGLALPPNSGGLEILAYAWYINAKDRVTVYDFSGQSQLSMNEPFDEGIGFGFGRLITWYGLYQKSPDYRYPHESDKEIYEWRSENSKCDDILKYLIQAYNTVQNMRAYYGLTWRNSNSTAAFGLRACGLSGSGSGIHPPGHIWFPGYTQRCLKLDTTGGNNTDISPYCHSIFTLR